MTPQEKAIEIAQKYLLINKNVSKHWFECAIIAVDEILNLGLLSFKDTDNEFLKPTTIPYWQQVKEELIKLKQ